MQRALTIKNGQDSTLIVAPGCGGGFLGQLSLTVQDGRVVALTNNLIADSSLTAPRKIDPAVAFGMSSRGTPRNFILQGPITVEDAYYARPFDNKLVIVEAKGQTVLVLSVQRRVTDSKRHAIGNAGYTLDRTTGKISDVVIDGQPFDPSRTYKIAVNDFMADGASGFTLLPALKRRNTTVLQRDALIAHIETVKTMIPQIGRIKVVGR